MRVFTLGLMLVTLMAFGSPPTLLGQSTVLSPVSLPGLQQPVKVVQDVYGIPHVFADNLLDLYRVIGYLHARDRLFQMDVLRRTASGTLAELLGPGLLAQDTQARTVGLRRAAERTVQEYSGEALEELRAYADGVNAFIAEGKRPAPYQALEISKIEPWTLTDSAVVGKALAAQLSLVIDAPNYLTYAKYREVGAKNGFNGHALYFDDLFRNAPAEPAVILRDAEGKALLHTTNSQPSAELPPIDANALRLIEEYYQRIKDLDFFQPALNRRESLLGSNWVIVSGQHTESGLPMLFNDPHLGLENPTIWYLMDQKVRDGAELNVVGSTLPGVPYVILGHNDKIAWAATNNPMDVTDMFIESVVTQEGKLFTRFRGQLEPIIEIPEKFRVNRPGDGIPDNLEDVPSSDSVPAVTRIVPRHGPLLIFDRATGQAVSIQYTAFYATREVNTFRLWNRARNLEEFKEGLKSFDAPSQNWGYADVEGNIAFLNQAELPLREDLQRGRVDLGLPPFFIRDGSGSALHQWIATDQPDPDRAIPFEILPFEEMPQIVNPPAGFIVTANNDPLGHTLDNDPFNEQRRGGGIYYLNHTYDIGFRATRITELVKAKIGSGQKLSRQDLQRIQSDTVTLIGRRLMPHILKAYENAQAKDAPSDLAALIQDARLVEAIEKYLMNWSFATPTGIKEGYDAGDAYRSLPEPAAPEITDSVATTLFNVWLSVFTKNVLDATLDRLDPTTPKPDSFSAIKALLRLLENFNVKRGKGESGLDFFDAPEVQSGELDEAGRRDALILLSLQEALQLLAGEGFVKAFNGSKDLADYRWGKLHRITLRSALNVLMGDFNIPPSGGFEAPEYADGLPTDGSLAVVDVANYGLRDRSDAGFRFRSGPSMRHIVELNPAGVRSFNSIPGGQSGGVPGSAHYADLLPMWLVNEYFPVYYAKGEIEMHAESTQDFLPGK